MATDNCKPQNPTPDDDDYFYTKYFTRNGKRYYAAWYGLKVFRCKKRKKHRD